MQTDISPSVQVHRPVGQTAYSGKSATALESPKETRFADVGDGRQETKERRKQDADDIISSVHDDPRLGEETFTDRFGHLFLHASFDQLVIALPCSSRLLVYQEGVGVSERYRRVTKVAVVTSGDRVVRQAVSCVPWLLDPAVSRLTLLPDDWEALASC